MFNWIILTYVFYHDSVNTEKVNNILRMQKYEEDINPYFYI